VEEVVHFGGGHCEERSDEQAMNSRNCGGAEISVGDSLLLQV
jgi:hypothetical protein